MGLFSRKKKTDAADQGAGEPDAAVPAEEAPAADDAPEVNISFSAFRGVGAPSGPEVEAPGEPGEQKPSAPQQQRIDPDAGAHQATRDATPHAPRQPAPQPSPPARPELPKAPAAPPAVLETVPGLRDNALVREALAAMPDKPTGAQVMGVLRQVLQGHLFLRVKGDAREQIAEGKPVTFGVARIGDANYMLAYSSGKALREAVQADGDTATSAVAQPVHALLTQLVKGEFGGIIIDGSSAPNRVVLPKEIVRKSFEQADPEFRLKALLAAPREADTPRKVAQLLTEEPPLWVAVGTTSEDEKRMGVAEARLADGTRLVQIHSHPLEVVAQGRGERALPLAAKGLGKLLRDHPEVGGVLVDPAGPLMTLTREELAPLIALAED
jgi:hypothetical protein